MVKEKTKGRTVKPTREQFRLKNRSVVITQQDDRHVLEIDGRVEGFYRTKDGYLLKKDVYQRPAKTLRDAVQRYLEQETAR